MTQAVVQILDAVEKLSVEERADVLDRIVERFTLDVPPDVETAQVDEVRRRIAEVESGKVALIPGDVAMARIWSRLNERRKAS